MSRAPSPSMLISSDLNQVTPEKTTVNPSPKTETSCIAELKSGKVIFKQKPISLDNLSETMQEIVSFRGLVDASNEPLAIIPDEHLPLIAKLVHESDKSLGTLCKYLQSSLLPPTLELSQESQPAGSSDPLPAASLEKAIKAVAERTNYGITAGIDRPPATLCVWRWEVTNREWLPKSVREKAVARFNDRVAAKKHLQATFDDLCQNDRDAILKGGKTGKMTGGKVSGVGTTTSKDLTSQSHMHDKLVEASEAHESGTKKPGRQKKPADPEAIAKEKEKQEKKAIKADREMKDAAAKKRSAAVFANFFKPSSSKPSKAPSVAQAPPLCSSSSSATTSQSEFEITFKPFVVKKDAQLAPVNWFVAARRVEDPRDHQRFKGKRRLDVVVELDDEGREVMQEPSMDVDHKNDDVSDLSPRELLRSFLDSQPPSLHHTSRKQPARTLKLAAKYRVREIMTELIEAEVQGDHRTVRKLTALLKNRRKIPAKVFVFAENIRPGYLGTWTRGSSSIGPRTPLTRDLLSFDYDHDSDAEWEEGGEEGEEGGEDVDSQEESMDDDVSSIGSDMDGWLVDGDEVEIEPPRALDEPHPPPSNANKRKAGTSRELPNKRRKVVPLIPFQKGPTWEQELGQCEYEPFRTMRIQFFNDASFPIDPFTFLSQPTYLEKANQASAKNDGDGVFVVPALPDRLFSSSPGVAELVTSDARATKRNLANPAPPPKTTFPDAHVPLLLQKIGASNTNSFVVLLDTVFQDVKAIGIKKNALEVKLREVAEKDKAKRAWVVKEDTWTRYGLVKPA